MANLPETPDYPAGVYQLETSDPVLGGAGGIANRQAEQLGNRTAWLKAKIDAFLDGTVAVLKATKLATARTLSISGAGSGSASFDGSSNANIVLTLADSGVVAGSYPKVTVNAKGLVTEGAPLTSADIPVDLALSGTPTAPTAVPSANSTQLANTAFVKAAIAALVASSPAALDTLNELAAALGNDPNFATTITNALAGKAPLASPALTGNPTAPTQAQFDADTSLATTEFVQRALGNLRSEAVVSASTTLTAAAAGQLIVGSSASPMTTTLPLAGSCPAGTMISFIGTLPLSTWIVQRQGTDIIDNNGGATFITLGVGDSAVFESNGSGTWRLIGGSASLRKSADFGASLGASGYQKLPSGKIEQWIVDTGAFSAGVERVLTLPVTFPIGVMACVAMAPSASHGGVMSGRWVSNSQIGITSSQNIAAGAGVSVIIYGR